MSIWTRISDALSALAQGESLTAVFEKLRSPPERSVAFTIAVIALGAKMAKADGQVTRDEVTAFRDVFQIAREDEEGAARVFNMARTDVAGYQDYARKIARMFSEDNTTLCDLMEGLFHIAMADGFYHPNENEFLEEVSRIFGQTDAQFLALRARFVPEAPNDPYVVLGVSRDMPVTEIRKVWRQLVRETHPDAMMARGVPEEAIRLAEKKMIDINRAWDEINGAAA
ncbi:MULTISPECIES: molecular chaperone DjiA [unclassified Ruegeria]|uniref:molecular chaperone DjiA n=1 Tax=unclassified Ruegeria TaxID=2625375 RepID=UPI001488CBCF|nr:MULTISPECIES: molecular chaperone DjiA [unclassified Ruegeria]NOD61937.1 DnaJ domain-containing protein [Ruegeria sp. HKCCD6109]NOD74684.1 DnaJ domain-containing protein [Ruegeria sp. HKCCD4332]NOD88582.1 DnaJ domain-containing protein [Ruegeria sp. HKCCD4318]NOD92296.1 DnaJ domain-containing protein [Ruegeria sp. HKCCD4884]NOE12190.1 DnaJ domain-containing protein [Ruegeria sp. HKCCD4318-2]